MLPGKGFYVDLDIMLNENTLRLDIDNKEHFFR